MRDLLTFYASPTGRLNRLRYWIASGGLLAMFVGLVVLFAAIVDPNTRNDISPANVVIKVTLILAYLAMFYMNVVFGIKRFHDRNKSGWWLLLHVIPVVGSFIVGIELGFMRGTIGPNRFGPDPLDGAEQMVPSAASSAVID